MLLYIKMRRTERLLLLFWCPARDSNPHAFQHRNLNPACLPISSAGHIVTNAKISFYADIFLFWCIGRDSNSHSPHGEPAPEAGAYTNFATDAYIASNWAFFFLLNLHLPILAFWRRWSDSNARAGFRRPIPLAGGPLRPTWVHLHICAMQLTLHHCCIKWNAASSFPRSLEILP